ncbi:MAG: AMP-binding protein [Betaproteobacteria bacterium]
MLAEAAAARPDAEALVCGERRLTYREYYEAVNGFAAGLEGPRIATVLGNSIEACIAMFGVLASGAQLVPINPLYTQREVDEIVADAEPSAVIASRFDLRYSSSRELPKPENLALLQYTGGTTGKSKGVNLTHRAIATNVAQREALLPTAMDAERILCAMPLFHSYGMAMGLFLAANCRGTLVIMERYRPDDLLRIVQEERITIFPGSPTIFTGLLGHADFSRTDWSTVHTCYSGAAALPEETLRRWEKAVGAPVYEGYGQTEAGPVLTFNAVNKPRKAGSVGIPVPDTEIRLVEGEVVARGPQIMQGYRNRPRETAEALRDGWLHTGDMGELDADGYLYIRDRKKDMVIVGGYNVYPREVEEVLASHPAVAEAAVVGGPDAYRGECLHAYVALTKSASVAELLAWCGERLARYKIPATLEVLEALPKTSVNKLDKLSLKARWKSS